MIQGILYDLTLNSGTYSGIYSLHYKFVLEHTLEHTSKWALSCRVSVGLISDLLGLRSTNACFMQQFELVCPFTKYNMGFIVNLVGYM